MLFIEYFYSLFLILGGCVIFPFIGTFFVIEGLD